MNYATLNEALGELGLEVTAGARLVAAAAETAGALGAVAIAAATAVTALAAGGRARPPWGE